MKKSKVSNVFVVDPKSDQHALRPLDNFHALPPGVLIKGCLFPSPKNTLRATLQNSTVAIYSA
jgi:hypothetical protein